MKEVSDLLKSAADALVDAAIAEADRRMAADPQSGKSKLEVLIEILKEVQWRQQQQMEEKHRDH